MRALGKTYVCIFEMRDVALKGYLGKFQKNKISGNIIKSRN